MSVLKLKQNGVWVPISVGAQGTKGDQGATGPTNKLTIGTVTSGIEVSATITGEAPNQVLNLVLKQGDKGTPGDDAPTITGITIRQSDYHMIVTLSDGTSYDAGYCRGASGAGTGDMLASTYDPQSKAQDIFAYVDNAISGVTVTTDATPTQGSINPVQSGGVYTALSNKLDKTGDGSSVTAAFTAASSRANIATGEKLSVLFGKIAKWFSDLGSLAFKSTVSKTDLASDVQTSLGKADSALQSVTKSDVGLGNVDNVKQYSTSNPPPYPVTSVNGQTGEVTVNVPTVPSTTSLIKSNGSGGLVAATPETDYASPTIMRKVTLLSGSWNSTTKQLTATVPGVLADTTKQEIRTAPVDASYDGPYKTCVIEQVAQAANQITYQCSTVPTANIDVYVTIRAVKYAT